MAIYIHNNGIDHNNEVHISEIIKFLNMKFNYKRDIKYNSEIKCIVPNNMIMLDYYKDRICINPISFYGESLDDYTKSSNECADFLTNLVSYIREQKIESIND